MLFLIIKILEITKIPEVLKKLGKASLEIYVVHLIIRGVLIYLLKMPIKENKLLLFLFYLIFPIVSVAAGFFVQTIFYNHDVKKKIKEKQG